MRRRLRLGLTSLLLLATAGALAGPLPAAARGGRKYLAREPIQRVIRERLDDVRGCYQAALARDPEARGRIVVRMLIEQDGRVVEASLLTSQIPDPEFERCVVAAVRTWVFPPNGRGGRIAIHYPFLLSP